MTQRNGASYRDPSGFIFYHAGRVYRQVNACYAADYDRLLSSGLYRDLQSRGLLIAHEEADLQLAPEEGAHRVLAPEPIAFISYPHEWGFGQLRDAALLTLQVQERALEHEMVLKDASSRNVQFVDGSPVFIDTLSFATYRDGQPWVAYRQFCEHFLAPLALMCWVDPRLGVLQRPFLDGVPLELASRALPLRTWLRPSLALHLHLHARSVARYAARDIKGSRWDRPIPKKGVLGLVHSLRGCVSSMKWHPERTEWAGYDSDPESSEDYREAKEEFVRHTLRERRPGVVWDLGANTGRFSRLAAAAGARVVSMDSDPGAIELLYRQLRADGEEFITPILVDLLNPTQAAGWAGGEVEPLERRGPADLVLALALVHHLAIGSNVPLPAVASWLGRIADAVVVEFVPKDDPQAQRLLVSREDVFASYDRASFEEAFGQVFDLVRRTALPGGNRILYEFQRVSGSRARPT